MEHLSAVSQQPVLRFLLRESLNVESCVPLLPCSPDKTVFGQVTVQTVTWFYI